MSIFLYWGEDDFGLQKAVTALRDRVLDPIWASFNYDKISPDRSDAIIVALNQAMTPPFGAGGRLVWLVDTTLCQHCSEELLDELERTLPAIPDSSTLLLTSRTKPDGRLKSTKLLQNHADIREFSLIAPWKTEQLVQQVRQVAGNKGLKLTPEAAELLAQAVGNDTRLLSTELDKLQLYAAAKGGQEGTIEAKAVTALVTSSTQNSLQLAGAIRQGDAARAIALVADLINRNEPGLKIVATLIGQFRTWLWVKLMLEAGERDDKIASAAEIGNPKRVYILRQEVSALKSGQLSRTLPLLLELEVSLKRGADPLSTLQTKVIELCQLCKR
ncbi:DNA polymerase III subunit delta [Microcoleus sp. FACHB-831]|uniref:DNA polymerase III subunit delta n=1 Tax=Microcoleus sp. FACHB-831 TaxID=2692827 RepID=UPI001683F0DE|nr:DNA polymerase III subunit delta [Microcoleus sp. FACHB-831]MBD1920804.1 DNA polymerase III subunit delta [Microcoleus sp. FACHB-831]